MLSIKIQNEKLECFNIFREFTLAICREDLGKILKNIWQVQPLLKFYCFVFELKN